MKKYFSGRIWRNSFRPLAFVAVMSGGLSGMVHAQDVRVIDADDGRTMFELRYYEPHDTPFPEWPASWSFSEGQKGRMTETIQRWAHILRPGPAMGTGVLNFLPFDVPMAYASSDGASDDGLGVTRLRNALLGRADASVSPFGAAHADVVIGALSLDDGQYAPSQHAGSATGYDLAGIVFHEFAHALGVTASVVTPKDEPGKESLPKPHFSSEPTLWNSLLRDDHGRAARPGQAILCSVCGTPAQPDAFDLRQDRGYVTGLQVDEVLAGAMPGLPVRILNYKGRLDTDYMSHLELDNSLMSHQPFRNYMTFMEAELAVMQLLGYDIDRRRLFGRSVYGNGLSIINQDGYYERGADARAYLPGTYSTATLGMGLHVYGSHNRVTQAADLLTRGPGAVGIRVDGQGNDLIVPAGIKVHGLGENGAGALFSYGRNHTLVHAGDIQATGPNGVGIKADFGNNVATNEAMVRGSYLLCDGTIGDGPCHAPWRSNQALLPELDGPLLDRLDITGRVAGTHAAIEATETALIGRIDVMRGARIDGDILSRYEQRDEQGRLRLTRLTLGLLADGQGRALKVPDADFQFVHEHDMRGENLSLRLAGGFAVLNGRHELHDVSVDPAATLAGQGYYRINGPGQAFVNAGRVVPGNGMGTMRVAGNYRQTPTGVLEIAFDGAGRHGVLEVDGAAALSGGLRLRAQPDWYASGWMLRADEALAARAIEGEFDHTQVELASPTLHARLAPDGKRLYIERAPDAYARWASASGAAQTAAALDHIAGQAPSAMQPLYRQLDFSRPDGGEVATALAQLAPSPYAALNAAQYDTLRLVGDALSGQQRLDAASTPGDVWVGFALPFHQQARRMLDDSTAFRHDGQGVVMGFGRRLGASPWTAGVHAAFSTYDVRMDQPLHSRVRSAQWQMGAHLDYASDTRRGWSLQAQWRFGRGQHRMRRSLDAANYRAEHEARWHSTFVQARVEGGYLWAWSDRLGMGPVAVLDYIGSRQPAREESGPEASRLTLASGYRQSLRMGLGWRVATSPVELPDDSWQAYAQLTREHELLAAAVSQRAAFYVRPDVPFASASMTAGRGAWRVQAGISHRTPRLSLAAYLEGQLAAQGQRQLAAQLSVGWRF